MIDDALDRVLAKLDRLDERVADLRVDLAALREGMSAGRAQIDRLERRVAVLEATPLAPLERRVTALEAAPPQELPRSTKVATLGVAAGSGGLVSILIDLVSRLLGGGP